MKDLPFYMTWSKQKGFQSLEIDSLDTFHYQLKNKSRVLDFTSLSFQSILGLKNQELEQAMCTQTRLLPMASPKMIFDLKQKVSETLLNYLQLPKGKIFYCLSGSEAIENASKMARQITNRKVIAARTISYHGATFGASALTGDWRNQTIMTPDEWVLRIPEPKDDPSGTQTRKIIEEFDPKNIAAICLETISGANGVFSPPLSWCREIQSICDQYSIMLIMDEVICAFERIQGPLALHQFNLRPDFICMAKAITAGYFPMGAVWTSSKVAAFFDQQTLVCGLTNYAHPIGLAVIQKVIEIISKEAFKNHLEQAVEILKSTLAEIEKLESVKEVRSAGLMAAIDLKEETSQDLWENFIKLGLSVLIKPKRIVIAPALNIPHSYLNEGLAIIKDHLKG